jgi:hypothetical protein
MLRHHSQLVVSRHPCQFFLDGRQEFFFPWKLQEMLFFPHHFAVDPDAEFTDLAGRIDLGANAGLTFHKARHTGGMQAIVHSDFAITDDHFFHFLFLSILCRIIFN